MIKSQIDMALVHYNAAFLLSTIILSTKQQGSLFHKNFNPQNVKAIWYNLVSPALVSSALISQQVTSLLERLIKADLIPEL